MAIKDRLRGFTHPGRQYQQEAVDALAEIERLEAERDELKNLIEDVEDQRHEYRKRVNGELLEACKERDELKFQLAKEAGLSELQTRAVEGLSGKVTELEAERDELLAYHEKTEQKMSALLYGLDHILDHFDEDGQIKGQGDWRLTEIANAARAMDDAVTREQEDESN